MWTHHDNYNAMREGWLITSFGFYQIVRPQEYIENRAKEGSSLHVRAIQHLALCKLLNISTAPKD
jgi:hypothetical protein